MTWVLVGCVVALVFICVFLMLRGIKFSVSLTINEVKNINPDTGLPYGFVEASPEDLKKFTEPENKKENVSAVVS